MKQKTIQGCSKAVMLSAVLTFIFCIVMAVFTAQIGENETFNILFSTAFAQAQKLAGGDIPKEIEDQKPVVILGAILIILTCIGILFACIASKTMSCICNTINMILLFVLSIVLMVFGAILVGPRVAGTSFIQENCAYASSNQLDKIDMYSRQIFEPIVDFDRQFQEGVNKQMCTEFCVCPGAPTDTHYIEYSKVPDNVYKKFERKFSTTPVDNRKQLLWNGMPNAPNQLANAQTSDSMSQCLENAQAISAKLAQASGNQADADKKKKEIEDSKPDPTFVKIVSHIEDKYSCSGLCEKPLFYFTQSVKKGPPKTPCLEPLIDDVSLLLQNLGGVLLITGIFFFFMFFCSIPICCYNKEKEVHENDIEEQEQKAEDRSERYKQETNAQANNMA